MWYLPAAKIIETLKDKTSGFPKTAQQKKNCVASLYNLSWMKSFVKFFFYIMKILFCLMFTLFPHYLPRQD